MGDRVSIQFQNENEKSIVLFSHWQGMSLVKQAKRYVENLKATRTGQRSPLDRFEPETVMVDFIRHITKDMEVVDSDLYVVATENDGDNSDNGHFIIKL